MSWSTSCLGFCITSLHNRSWTGAGLSLEVRFWLLLLCKLSFFALSLAWRSFFVLLGGLELPNVKRPSLPPGSSKGESKARDSTEAETEESKDSDRREVTEQHSGWNETQRAVNRCISVWDALSCLRGQSLCWDTSKPWKEFENCSTVPVLLLKEFFPARHHSRDEQRPLTAKNRGQGFDSVLCSGIYPTSYKSVNAHRTFSSLFTFGGRLRITLVCLWPVISPPVWEGFGGRLLSFFWALMLLQIHNGKYQGGEELNPRASPKTLFD